MIDIGIFAKTFDGSLDDILEKVKNHGLSHIQFNFSIAGLASMPDKVTDEDRQVIQALLEKQQLSVEAVSGTFNMIHPDPEIRVSGLRSLSVIAAQCGWLNTKLITLCTGTRNASNMWTAHPDNNGRAAWYDLRESIDLALMHADQYDLQLGVEPELSNVINSVEKAAQLIKEVNSPRLKIVYDPANLFEHDPVPVMVDGISAAIDLLGNHIVSVHAKDRDAAGGFVAAGDGVLPYAHLVQELTHLGYKGNLILHGLATEEVKRSIAFLKTQLNQF